MKRPQVVVVLLGVVLVAASAWFVLRGRGGSPSATGPAVTQADAGAASTTRGSGDRPDAPGDRGGEPAILIDDDPVGTLVLEGQVIDESTDGVGGATVVISSNPPRTATTEADGSFSFDELVGRAYQIEARAPAGVAGPITARLTASSDPVILKLVAASAVAVEVVDDKGQVLDGATVELRGLDVQASTTAGGGKATITPVVPGGYQLAAWAPGFARSYAWIQVAGAEVTARIALRRGAAVSGRVVGEDGTPIAGARVTFGGASDWSVQADDRLDGQVTGEDGRFTFDAVGAGSMRFDARHPDHAPGTSKIIPLDGTTPVTDVEIVLPDGATVSGVVVDGGGAPVASARVRVGVAGAGFASAGPRQVFSDEHGVWEVKGLPERKLEAVAIAEVGSSATTPIDATKGDVAGVKLLVDQTGTIAGIVVDPSGEPVEGVQVSAGPDFRAGGGGDPSWRLRGFQQELTDSGGRFTLTGLAAGNYRVRATRGNGRGGRGFGPGPNGGGVAAKTGDQDVRIELPLDGAVEGKVAFDDGTAPTAFTVAVPFSPEPFASKDGAFLVGELTPGDYDVQIRGTGFAPKIVKAKIEGGKTTDLGTITVVKGRTIRGTVMAGGAPVAGATVYLGAQIFGNGSTNKADFGGGPPGAGDVKTVTTDANGAFSISGFARRDLTIIAEHEEHGRSKPLRLVAGDPGEQALIVELQAFGSLSGLVTEGGAPLEGNLVNVQSTTAPGAMYGVASGADGAFRLDRLAPDTYKVSAMTGMNPMRGMGFFSKTVTVASGAETKIDVSIQKGTITLSATANAAGASQVAGMSWIASGTLTASNGKELSLKLAAQGEGFSNFTVMMPGQPARFRELTVGNYSVCLLPLPAEVTGMQGMGYAMRHMEDLPAFCKAVALTAAPDDQAMTIDVEIPPVLPDE